MSLPLGQGEIFPKIWEFDILNISRQKQVSDITSVRDKLGVKVVEGIRDRSLRTQCEAGAETAVVRQPCSSGQPPPSQKQLLILSKVEQLSGSRQFGRWWQVYERVGDYSGVFHLDARAGEINREWRWRLKESGLATKSESHPWWPWSFTSKMLKDQPFQLMLHTLTSSWMQTQNISSE